MQYAIATVTPPAAEPVPLELAKAHLRIDHDEENELLKAWVAAARELTEAYTGRRWVTQTLRMTLPYFPAWDVEFPVEPVASVTSVKYLDAVDGTEQTVDAADWQTWLDHTPPLLSPSPSSDGWPDVEEDRNSAVTITFVAGAAENEVPEMARTAILLCLGTWDENRGDQNALVAKGLPPGAKRLLDLLSTGSYLR